MSTGLKAQERVLDIDRARKLLRETAAESDLKIIRVLKVEQIKHRPNRRLVVRYEVECKERGGSVTKRCLYGKLYHGHRGQTVHAALHFLKTVAPRVLQFPQPLGYNAHRRFLLMSALEGLPLADKIESADGSKFLANFGKCLAIFHNLPRYHPTPEGPKGFIPSRLHDAIAELAVLEKARDAMEHSSIRPEIGDSFKHIFCTLKDRLLDKSTLQTSIPIHMIHRDLYPSQILVNSGAFGLVDLDELALGEAELDLGNFAAHLMLSDLQRDGEVGNSRQQARIFLESYSKMFPVSEDRRNLYTAASLYRLASLERISRPEISVLDWPKLSAALLDLAGSV